MHLRAQLRHQTLPHPDTARVLVRRLQPHLHDEYNTPAKADTDSTPVLLSSQRAVHLKQQTSECGEGSMDHETYIHSYLSTRLIKILLRLGSLVLFHALLIIYQPTSTRQVEVSAVTRFESLLVFAWVVHAKVKHFDSHPRKHRELTGAISCAAQRWRSAVQQYNQIVA